MSNGVYTFIMWALIAVNVALALTWGASFFSGALNWGSAVFVFSYWIKAR